MQTIDQQKKNIEEYKNKLEEKEKALAELEGKIKQTGAVNVRIVLFVVESFYAVF